MKRSPAEVPQLVERLQFERLLADISAHFINLPADRIGAALADAQRRICACLDLDICSLWQWSPESPLLPTLTHWHGPSDGLPHPGQIKAGEVFPWLFAKMLRGETFAFATAELPPEAACDLDSCRSFGIESSLVIPLAVGGGPPIGVLAFNTLKRERTWAPETVDRLHLVAQIFANALARRDSDRKIRENEARLILAVESAGAILWDLDLDSGSFWSTAADLGFFGFAPDRVVDFDSFLAVVHPDDRPVLHQALVDAIAARSDFRVEYRIVGPDGGIRWIISRGRPHPASRSRLMGVSVDITKRKVFEAQIISSEERLAAAIAVAALGFYELRENQLVSFVDNRMRSLLGITPADGEPTRDFWLAHIHPDDLPTVKELSRRVLTGGVDRLTSEYRYLHPQSGLIWVRQLSRVLERNAAGEATRVVGVMQDVTERKLKEIQLQENQAALSNSQKDLRRLAGKLISTQEEELRRLSRELHDDLTQRLAVLAIEAGKLEGRSERGAAALPADARQKIGLIKAQLIAVSEDVHRISRQLHPTILDDLGLVQTMESECEALQGRHGIEIDFRHEQVTDRIPNNIALCLYRITQEGLKNIIRHAGVSRCEVVLESSGDKLHLTISDSGAGFDPLAVRTKPGLGLSSMRERAQLVEGDFSIDSRPGRGTVIRVSVPYTRGEA